MHWSNPYYAYCGGAAGFLIAVFYFTGWAGVFAYLGLAAFAQSQLLLSDYVQHYGLKRHMMDNDKFEPIGVEHSWNSRQVFSSALMLNVPRHSDHHVSSMIPFAELRTRAPDGAPVLPYSLPVMSTLALYPRIWKRVMNPRVSNWYSERGQKITQL